MIMLVTYLVGDKQFPEECYSQVSHFMDIEFNEKPYLGCQNSFLMRAHKQAFLESNFVASIGRLFNEQPLSDIPFIYKVYLLALQIHGEKGITFEGRRSLISDTIECLPCIAN